MSPADDGGTARPGPPGESTEKTPGGSPRTTGDRRWPLLTAAVMGLRLVRRGAPLVTIAYGLVTVASGVLPIVTAWLLKVVLDAIGSGAELGTVLAAGPGWPPRVLGTARLSQLGLTWGAEVAGGSAPGRRRDSTTRRSASSGWPAWRTPRSTTGWASPRTPVTLGPTRRRQHFGAVRGALPTRLPRVLPCSTRADRAAALAALPILLAELRLNRAGGEGAVAARPNPEFFFPACSWTCRRRRRSGCSAWRTSSRADARERRRGDRARAGTARGARPGRSGPAGRDGRRGGLVWAVRAARAAG